jgi:hypothetical protein
MISCKKFFAGIMAVAAVYGILFYVARGVIANSRTGMNEYHGLIMIGMSYFLGENTFTDSYSFLLKESLLRFLLTVGVFLIVFLFRKLKQESILLLILVIEVVISFNACNNFIFTKQEHIYGDIALGQELKEIRALYPDRRIIYVFEGGIQYIELVQFTDRDAHIEAINAEYDKIDISECLNENSMLILAETSEYLQAADDFYDGSRWQGHLYIFYMKE